MHLRAVPRLGGLAIFLGIFIPALAFLDLSGAYRGILLGAAVATAVGMADDFRGLPWAPKLAGQGAGGRHRDPLRRLHRPLQLPGPRRPRAAVLVLGGRHGLLDRRDDERDQPDRRDGRARGGDRAIAGATFALLALELGRPEAAVLSAIVAARASGSCATTSTRPRSSWGTRARTLLGFLLATVAVEGVAQDRGDDRAGRAAPRARGPHPRYVVRDPEAAEVRTQPLRSRPEPLLPPLPPHRALAAENGRLPPRLGGSRSQRGAIPSRFVPFREPQGRVASRDRPLIVGGVGLVVVTTSLYMIYVLEILKAPPSARPRPQPRRGRRGGAEPSEELQRGP